MVVQSVKNLTLWLVIQTYFILMILEEMVLDLKMVDVRAFQMY